MSEGSDAPRFSVVICTRNPRQAYLDEVLAAADGQTYPASRRELVVVDSCSDPPMSQRNIDWPANVSFVRLQQPGVGRARIAGVSAARGDWIVFVDDDNVIDPDYLEKAEEIIQRRPDVALFCGRISGDFEGTPPAWLKPFYRQLAIIDFPEDSWANHWDPAKVGYWAAGMCVRRDVIEEFCDEIHGDPVAIGINRGEDIQLVMHALSKKHVAGLFRALHLRHLIPRDRMTTDYLCRIVGEAAYNMTVLRCRDTGVGIIDFLKPSLLAARSTVQHGWAPAGRIGRAGAYAQIRGATACFRRRS